MTTLWMMIHSAEWWHGLSFGQLWKEWKQTLDLMPSDQILLEESLKWQNLTLTLWDHFVRAYLITGGRLETLTLTPLMPQVHRFGTTWGVWDSWSGISCMQVIESPLWLEANHPGHSMRGSTAVWWSWDSLGLKSIQTITWMLWMIDLSYQHLCLIGADPLICRRQRELDSECGNINCKPVTTSRILTFKNLYGSDIGPDFGNASEFHKLICIDVLGEPPFGHMCCS